MQNNANGISITILENQNDIEQSLGVMLGEKSKKKHWTNRLRKAANTVLLVVCLLSAATAVLYAVEGSAGMTIAYILNTVIIFFFWLLMKKSARKNKINNREYYSKIRMMDYPNGYYPVTYRFADDSITQMISGSKGSCSYKDISYIRESAEGIYIALTAPLMVYNIWLPARFISKHDYERLSSLLKEKTGKKYEVQSPMNAADTAESVYVEGEITPQGEKKAEFSYKYSRPAIIKGIIKSIFFRIRSMILLLPLMIIGFFLVGSVRDVISTGKLVLRIARLVAKYTELGQVISQADIIDTCQSLIITVCGLLFSAFLLVYIVLYSYQTIYRIIYTVKEYIASKPLLDGNFELSVYDDCISEKNGELSACVTRWNEVQKAVKKPDSVEIYGSRGKKYMIPLSSLEKEQKNLLFSILTERLGRNWHKPQAAITTAENAVFKADTYGTKEEQQN